MPDHSHHWVYYDKRAYHYQSLNNGQGRTYKYARKMCSNCGLKLKRGPSPANDWEDNGYACEGVHITLPPAPKVRQVQERPLTLEEAQAAFAGWERAGRPANITKRATYNDLWVPIEWEADDYDGAKRSYLSYWPDRPKPVITHTRSTRPILIF